MGAILNERVVYLWEDFSIWCSEQGLDMEREDKWGLFWNCWQSAVIATANKMGER